MAQAGGANLWSAPSGRSFLSADLSADLLILDNLGLHRLTGQESADLYELMVSRRRVSSFVITSNRAEELIILPGRWPSGGHEAAPDRERNAPMTGVPTDVGVARYAPVLRGPRSLVTTPPVERARDPGINTARTLPAARRAVFRGHDLNFGLHLLPKGG